MKKILFLEDDSDHAEPIEEVLREAFPDKELFACSTEYELIEAIRDIPVGDLYFAILDAMVPWCFPSEDMPIPPTDVQSDGIRYAGKRSLERIRYKYGTEVPVWIHSILQSEGHGVTPAGKTYVLEKNPELDLLQAIKKNL